MARRPSKHLRAARPLSGSFATAQDKGDGRWAVQSMPAGRSEKEYLCPGCNRTVAAGAAHVVTWPTEPRLGTASPVDDRRHWHTPCWNRRR